MLETLGGDLRWAVRHALRRPLFGVVVSATLAVSIAAATTAFGLATAVLWRPLPFRDADRLVFVWEHAERDGQPASFRVTGNRFAGWRDHSRSFASMSMFGAAGFSLEGPDGPAPVRGVRVSAGYFDTLGVVPLLGRGFRGEDEQPGREQVVVLSHGLWQQRFGGRPGVLGETIRLSGRPYSVVGVMPPIVFPGWPVNPASVTIDPASRELWVPIARSAALDQNARSHVFGVVGRLAPAITLDGANDELNRLPSDTAADPHSARLAPLREQFVRDARLPLLALMGAALAVLLVACANLAALHVSAFEGRRAELSVRAALGASARRLAQQLASESLLLAVLGGTAGILLARYALLALPGALPPSVPIVTPATLDLRVAAFAVAIVLGSGLLLALWPVSRLLARGPAPRGVSGQSRGVVYRVLVVAQLSITVALTASAALLTQSLWTVRGQNPGFILKDVFVTDIGLPAAGFDTPAKAIAFEDRLRGSLEERAAVDGVALAYDHPLESNWTDSYTWVGENAGATDAGGQAHLRIVSPAYFETLGVEVHEGRTFTNRSGLDAPGLAVVNEAFVRAQSGPVLGRRFRSAAAQLTWGAAVPAEFEIVGVVENERFRGLEAPAQPAVYLSTRQFPQTSFTLLIRASAGTRRLNADVRAGLRALEPTATMDRATTLEAILDEQLVARRMTSDVIGGFAGAALALAAVGLYGLLAMLVASRQREIGVRLALGASPGTVARDVLGDSLRSTAAGVVCGLALALLAGRALQGLLVGVTSRDPLTLVLVTVTLLAIATIAAMFPAWRAANVDPAIALRAQ
jgi:predicted permease